MIDALVHASQGAEIGFRNRYRNTQRFSVRFQLCESVSVPIQQGQMAAFCGECERG
ncbi:hypothetical protein D3C86_1843510 [compost metagenome]